MKPFKPILKYVVIHISHIGFIYYKFNLSTGLTTLPDRVVMGPCCRVSSGTTTLLGRVFRETAVVSCC